MDPKQLFPAHFESVFGKNKVLFPRELKKDYSQGNKKSIIPKNKQQKSNNGPKIGLKNSQNGPKTIISSPL